MLHRFFLAQKFDKDILFLKDRALVHQLKRVLRVRRGDRVIFFNDREEDRGFEFIVEIKTVDSASIACLVRERVENRREPTKKLTLYAALIKKDKFEWILQKGTEIGIHEFVPVVAAHSEKKNIKIDRALEVIREAAEQSGRATIPALQPVMTFEKALEHAQTSGAKNYFAHTAESENRIRGAGDRTINLFVGPEGGWDDKEIFAAARANFETISLGRLTLRSETAAIVGSYTLLWG